MKNQDFQDSNQSKSPVRKVTKISISAKYDLIKSVVENGMSIHQAAKLHNINYSSAKYIVSIYSKTGKVVQEYKKPTRKHNYYHVDVVVVTDQKTGEILLYKKSQFKKHKLSIQKNKSLYMSLKYASNIFLHEHQNERSNKSLLQQNVFIQNLNEVKNLLVHQHQMMMN